MNRLIRFALPVLAVVVAAMPAHAQHIASPYKFIDASQELGAYWARINADKGAAGLGSESGNAYGVRYGLRLSGPLMIDVDAMYFPTHVAVLDTTVTDSAYTQLGTASQPLVVTTASVRFNLTGPRTWHGLWPYVAFGIGAAIETSKDKGAIDQAPIDARYTFGTSFAGVLGAGLEFFPAEHVSLRFDARNLLWKVKTPAALIRGRLGATLPADEWLHNGALSAGVSIHF